MLPSATILRRRCIVTIVHIRRDWTLSRGARRHDGIDEKRFWRLVTKMGRLLPVLGVVALASTVYGQSLPYSPSRILLAPNASTAYIIQPSRQYTGQAGLQSLDLKQPFTVSTSPFTTLYDTLPFLDSAHQRAYTPVIDPSGNITVVTGNCSDGAEGTLVYHFEPQEDGNGTWAQYQTTTERGLSSSGTPVSYTHLTLPTKRIV